MKSEGKISQTTYRRLILNKEKKLLIILYGEPRGIGNSIHCPGTNQLDVILNSILIHHYIDKIHVLWCVNDTTAVTYNKHIDWDNQYMIDKNGVKWDSKNYMNQSHISANIRNHMSEYKKLYGDSITHSVSFRDPNNTYRWGKDFYNCFKFALNGEYDFVISSRPDVNLAYIYENFDQNHNILRDILTLKHSEKPVVITTVFESKISMREYKDGLKLLQPDNFDIMFFNLEFIKLLEPFLRVSSIHNNNISADEIYKIPLDRTVSLFPMTIVAERFWSLLLNTMTAINHNVMMCDCLPWKAVIRKPVSYLNVHEYYDLRKNDVYRKKWLNK